MNDLNKALADINCIRARLAAGTTFQGFGPVVIAVTGVLALTLGLLQLHWPGVFVSGFGYGNHGYLVAWMLLACLCAVMIGFEMVARSRRIHGGLADAMLAHSVEQFLPAAAAGLMLTVVIFRYQTDLLWMLPGLWQLLLAVGLFAAARNLVRGVKLVAAWYFISAFVVLLLSMKSELLSPWLMMAPFSCGQLLMAVVLKLSRAQPGE